MRVFHLINGYFDTSLYRHFLRSLGDSGIQQRVHVPVRPKHEPLINRNPLSETIPFSYTRIHPTPFSRLFFHQKVRRVYRDLDQPGSLSGETLIHAHSLLSDGAVALKLNRKHGTPYVVAIRLTDILFLQYLVFFRSLGRKILQHAAAVVIVSPGHLKKLLSFMKPGEREVIQQKCRILPNGVDPYWLSRIQAHPPLNHEKIRLLYVGDMSIRKNVLTTIRAAGILVTKGYSVQLTLVGGRKTDPGWYGRRVRKVSGKLPWINLVDRTTDQDKLLNIYRESDIFLMPSWGETFGLTYVEALSQGLPVICSRGQGIDGYYPDGKVGYAVKPSAPEDIADKMIRIINDYNRISSFCNQHALDFDWSGIARTYAGLYESCLNF